MQENPFYDGLKKKLHKFIVQVYTITKQFPKEEQYSSVSQLRRAALSIMLNYVEGYGRRRPKVKLNFFEISYGSVRECKYLIYLSYELHWIEKNTYDMLFSLLDEIGAMIWSMIQGIEKNNSDVI